MCPLRNYAETMSLRRLAEKATHGFVFRRRLPPPYQQIRLFVSSEAGLRYLHPQLRGLDPTLLQLVTELVKPGYTVWDVGANVGLFAFTAASQTGARGRIVAVEADAWNVRLLRKSLALSGPNLAPIDIVPAAVSDVTGFARFHIARRNRSTNHLQGTGSTQTGGIRETQIVPTVTLDHLLRHFPVPDFLKIDVEGAEGLALTGATDVLRQRPAIVCEVAAENADAVRKILQPHGYRFYDAEKAQPRTALVRPPYSTIALPPDLLT